MNAERIDRSRRRVLAATALGVAGATGYLGLIRGALAMSGKPIIPGFNLVEGDVRRNGIPARVGDLVQAGDRLGTGRKSKAVVVIGTDALLLRENTSLTLEGKESTLVELLRLTTGAVLSVWGPRRRLDIKTAVSTIGIRGTAVYVEDEPDRTYVCTCYGKAELIPDAAPGQVELVQTTYHDQPRYIGKRADRAIIPAKVINHTDAELVMLEGLLKRRPPFLDHPIYQQGGGY